MTYAGVKGESGAECIDVEVAFEGRTSGIAVTFRGHGVIQSGRCKCKHRARNFHSLQRINNGLFICIKRI